MISVVLTVAIIILLFTSYLICKETFNPSTTIIKFYSASWCGHCKRFAPVWEQAIQELKNNPDVQLIKIDSESPEASNIKMFPTIVKEKPNTSPEEFTKERTLENLIKFAKQ